MGRSPRVKGIHRVRTTLAGGREVRYHYAWRGGPRFWSSDDGVTENGPDYWAAYNEALKERRPDTGRFRQVINAFLASREFSALRPRTQKDYRVSIFHAQGIDAKFGDAPLGAFDHPKIRSIVYRWRDGFASPRVADHRQTHLVKIVNWAVDRGYLTQNHLRGMTKLYSVDRSDIIWTDEEIEAFVSTAPRWLGRILIAATETGLRPDDLRRLSRSHVKETEAGARIYMRTGKRQRIVSLPVTPAMARVIEETPRDRLVILAGAKGRPYASATSLGQAVHRHRDELARAAEARGEEAPVRKFLRLYDARGTAATRLFQADASLREIATAMGWSVSYAARMIEVYCASNPDATDRLLVKLAGQKH